MTPMIELTDLDGQSLFILADGITAIQRLPRYYVPHCPDIPERTRVIVGTNEFLVEQMPAEINAMRTDALNPPQEAKCGRCGENARGFKMGDRSNVFADLSLIRKESNRGLE